MGLDFVKKPTPAHASLRPFNATIGTLLGTWAKTALRLFSCLVRHDA